MTANPDHSVREDRCSRSIALADGRILSWHQVGPMNGHPVLLFHGVPGSALDAQYFAKAARIANIRLISFDRAGIGWSSRDIASSVQNDAHDAAELLWHLRLPQVGVVGLSGGAAAAYSFAQFYAQKCRYVIDIAGWAPVKEVPELWASMSRTERYLGPLISKSTSFAALSSFLMARLCVSSWARSRMSRHLIAEGENEMVASMITSVLQRSVRHSSAVNLGGLIDEQRKLYGSWWVNFPKITRPVYLCFGAKDELVPPAFQEWKHRMLRYSRLLKSAKDSHLSLVLRQRQFGRLFRYAESKAIQSDLCLVSR